MSNNPTIIAASLDDKQMRQSIANLVADVKRATHTMTNDFDSMVDHINAKFKELGNGKNVSAKGGVSTNATKQSTQAVEENTNAKKKNAQAVSVASDAVTKETQKLQALQQSLSGASNREQEFVNKKQQAATAIAQENELLGKQQSELSALKAQQQQYNDAVRNQTNAVSSAEQKLKDAQQRRIDLEKQQGALKNDAKLASLKEEYKAISDLIAVAEKYKSVFAKMKDEDMSKMQGKFGWKSWGGLSDAERHLKDAYYDNRQAKWAKEGILSLDDEKVKAAIERVNMGILQAAKENYSRAIFDKIKNENWGTKDISSWIATMQSKMQRVVQSNRETGIDSRIDEEYQAYKHIISVLKEYLQYAEKVGQERKKLAESSVTVSTAMKNATTHDNVVGSMTNLDSRQFSLITSQMARENEIKDKLLANGNQLTEAKNKEAEAAQALSVEKKKLNDLEQQQVQATQQSAQASQQKATIDSQVAAKEAEIAATKGRISTATQSQSEAEKAAAAASKEKATIQTQVANQEKALVEAKKQLTTATQRQAEVEKQSVQAASQQAATADKQIKKNQEVSMSFDQIVAALDRARRTVSDFNTKRANGVLPSTEDYKRYEQALARIVEYNDKLKQSALGMANANEKWFGGFNAKRINESILPSNKTLSEMRAFYQEQEKNDQKRLAAREKMIEDARKAEQKYQDATLKSAFRGALTLPTNNIDELKYKIERITALTSTLKKEGLIDESQVNRANVAVAKLNEQINKQLATEKEVKAVQSQQAQPQVKSARDSYIAFMQGYKEQANQLTQLIQNEENRLVQAQQSRVTALGQQIDQNKTKIQGLREQMQQLAQEEKNAPTRYGVKDAYRTAIQQTNDEINKLIAKNKELEAEQQKVASTDPLKQQNATLDELRAKRDKVLNMMREETSSTQQQAQAQQQLTQSAKEYSEQVKKIATEIRESAQWQKSDKFGFKRGMMNFDGRAYPVTENLEMGIRLEDQIVSVLQRANDERQKGVQITQQQAQSSRQVSEEDRKAMEALGWVDSQQKKKYTPPVMNIERISEVRGALQSITGTQEKWVDSINKTKSSYFQLSDYVKQLKNELIHLPKGVHDDAAKVLISEIQQAEREMQKFQKTMSRPVSLKSALSGDEKTLDDIALKMQRLRAYKQGIDPVRRGADTEIRQINNELARLQKTADNWMGKQQEMIKGNTALGRSWNYMKNRLAFYLTVGATTQFVRQLVDIRSQYEMNERALGILIDSAERGTRIFNELSQMSLVSPYTLIELTTAAKQLSAYDIAAKDVVDTTRRLADMASAVGIPIERLTYALGQIKAYGYLNSRDARMFSNAGIPLVKQLSEYYTQLEGRLVSTADVYDRIKKKTVDFEEVVNVIHHMTDEGGKFFDFQAKMADTLKVRLANLQLAWNNMLNDIGEESEGVIRGGIGVLRDLFANWKDIKHYVDEAVVAFGAYKVAQLLIAQTTGVAARSMTSEILAMKRTEVELLRKKALTQELTASEKAMIATSKVATVTDYQNALSTKNLTKQKALLLAAFNMNNKKMLEALIRMGLLTSAEIRSMTVGKAMTLVFKSMGLAISSAARAIGAFLASNWVFILLGAAFELYHAFDSASEHIKDINKGLIEDAKNTYKDLKDFLESVEPIRIKIKAGKLEDSEAQKAWDDLRERLETLSANSAIYISKLMGQDDMTQRLKEGYEYAEMLQKVQGIIEGFGDEDIKGTETIWGGFFGEGLKDDIKDFLDVADELVKTYGSIEKAQGELDERLYAGKGIGGALADLYEMNKEIKETTNSIVNKSIEENLNIDEQRELFEKAIQKIANESKLSATETRVFRINSEKLYFRELAKMQRKGYNIDLEGARQEFASRKALQQEFFTWLSEVHSSETQKRISNASEEEIKNGEWLTKENKRWIQERAKEFSDKYKVSFGELNSLVQQANTWSIYIPVYFQTAKDSLSEFQKDFYKRAKETFQQDQATAKQVFAGILPEKDDAFPKWVKARQDEIKQLGEDRKKYERDETEWSKQHVKDIDEQIKHNKEALDLYHQPYEEPKDKKKKKEKDPILEALKLEISLVEKLRGDYDKLTKAGESQTGALATIHDAYGKTIKQLNAELKSFKLPQLDIAKIITGKDPKKQLDHFQKTLDSLIKNGLLNIERSKEVEAVLEKLKVSAKEYDFTELSKGIEKELNKLKESFDLGAALDAEPQLGNLFAKMYGFDTKELPRTFTELVQKAQSIIDNAFKGRAEARIDVSAILDKNAFEEWVKGTERELDSSLVQTVQKMRDYLVETQRKMISDTSKTYDKLLERYSEYQFKLIKIDKDSAADRLALIRKFATEQQSGLVHQAVDITNDITMSTDPEERERLVAELQEILKQVAGDNRVVLQIGVGIDTRNAEQKAQLAFEEFTKNPEWQIAIGDLEGMTHKALRMLIKDLEDFMETNKKLTPKQIRQIESTITKLHKQIRKNNPFAVLADAIEESKNRTKKLADEIEKKGKEIANIKLIPEDKRTKDDVEHIESLTNAIKKLKAEMKDMGKLNVETIVKAINDSVSSISTVTSSVTQMLEAIGHRDQLKAANAISTAMGVADAMGKGAQFGAQFGEWGAVIGAVAGGVSDLVNRFADFWSGNDKINTKIARSEREVKRLENAYADLEHQMKSAFGQGEIGANKLLIANKELQIAQLELQLELEKSRKKKNRDDEKIRDLQEQIATAKRELEDFAEDITESFLGISSVKDAVSSMIDGIINALKEGEDAMTSFNESWEEMCWNMIKQVVGTEILAPKFKAIFDEINTEVQERGKALSEEIATKKAEIAKIEQEGDKLLYYRDREGNYGATNNIYDIARIQKELGGVMVSYEEWLEGSNRNISTLEKTYAEAVQWSVDDLVRYSEEIQSLRGDYELTSETMEEVARKLGLTLGDKSQALSALQAGIGQITEDTAGAIESYLNIISQKIFEHGTIFYEIRDVISSWDMEAQLGVQSQMLLQLQNSYQVQMTIQNIMQGWSSPNGMSVRVELAS